MVVRVQTGASVSAVVDPGSRQAHPVEDRCARFRCWSEWSYGPRHEREVAMHNRQPTMRSRELGEVCAGRWRPPG